MKEGKVVVCHSKKEVNALGRIKVRVSQLACPVERAVKSRNEDPAQVHQKLLNPPHELEHEVALERSYGHCTEYRQTVWSL